MRMCPSSLGALREALEEQLEKRPRYADFEDAHATCIPDCRKLRAQRIADDRDPADGMPLEDCPPGHKVRYYPGEVPR